VLVLTSTVCHSAGLWFYVAVDPWTHSPCPPIDNVLKLMTVWRITGKIIRTTIIVNYICTCIMEFLQF